MINLLSVYHSLPHPLKTIMASARGYQLRWWRYSTDTERLVEDALEREHWTNEQWTKWRQERLAFMLHHAATKVPYYREYWQKVHARNPSISWNYLENWPVLEKETVRNNPQAFISDEARRKKFFIDHTGGTTGRPTLIYQSREVVVRWYALMEARLRRWYQLSYKQKWGMLGGQKVVALNQKSPPYWVNNYGLNQLYFSVFHISKETARDYIDALCNFDPSSLVVYPSILATLSHHMLEQGLKPPRLNAIFCNSEKILDNHRAVIQSAFDCPIVETYGMAEMTATASQCQAGTMHDWPEVGYLELYDRQSNEFMKTNNEVGEFIMTGLFNQDMPLIRYANGDAGTLPDTSHKCSCGRLLPKFGQVQGRANDLILTIDGRKLYILDSLFNGLPLIEGQVIQEKADEIRVILVTEISYSEKDSREIIYRLRQYLGDIKIVIDIVEKIPRDKNGKFRPFVSHL
jgi:phenylacetate-CoA ligase